ncbi:MAG: histidine phosphatase family protein [Aeromicrobium sp.]|nr:histidine phosphatase family protein [Aeromicrobium sp.]
MGSLHLIRHGQASWGADDYDQLSELGSRQSAALGISWEASGWAPTSVLAGGMKRHAQTAIATIDSAGQGDGYDVDAGWDEFDHLALAQAYDPDALTLDSKAFQTQLNGALDAWVGGSHGTGESFADFSGRVLGALDGAVQAATSGRTVAVFTSAGPIGLIVSHLLNGDASLFRHLNEVVVNASVTTVLVGRSGPRLLAFNEHVHLPRDMVTFR